MCHAVRPRGAPTLRAGTYCRGLDSRHNRKRQKPRKSGSTLITSRGAYCRRLSSNSPKAQTTREQNGVKIGRSIRRTAETTKLSRHEIPTYFVPLTPVVKTKNKTKHDTTHFSAGKIRENFRTSRGNNHLLLYQVCTTTPFSNFDKRLTDFVRISRVDDARYDKGYRGIFWQKYSVTDWAP